jgi:UDP-glucose-4-epimerase GalE
MKEEKPMAETILIAGGAGYIGSHAAKAVAASGRIPLVVDSLAAGHNHAVKWGPLEVADLRDTTALTAIIKAHMPVAIMHFAASIEVGIGEREPLAFYDNNVAGTISLLKAMKACDVTRLVFSSTCAVYGNAQPPLSEDMPRKPASVYGRSKAMVEEIIEDCTRAYGLEAVILRYFNACGADPDGDSGEEHDPETHLIPNALKAVAGLGDGLKVFGTDYPTPDGTCLRDYIHVSDLADAHVAALDLLAREGGLHVFNLGTGTPYSVLDVIKTIERVVGRAPPHELASRRAGDVPVLTANLGAAATKLGFRPKLSDLETIVSTAWAFHKKTWGV